jgi:chromosomal replication initiator protein
VLGQWDGFCVVSGLFSIPLDAPQALQTPAAVTGRTARLPLREYIGGDENVLARVAAEMILGSSERYNPLLFVGPTGVGKSHLALGLVERWQYVHRPRRAMATTGVDFARSYAGAVETDSVAELREKYLAADLVLIDDLQELAGKRSAQQELAQLLDELIGRHKLLVATANLLPAEVPHFAEALASRLSAGLCVPLTAPGLDARRAILSRLAALHQASLAPATVGLLAEKLAGTVPQLNHAVVELEQAGRRAKKEIDVDLVEQFLSREASGKQVQLRAISATVAKYFGCKTADLKGPSRLTGIVQARSLGMYLARRLTDETLERVGEHFGKRDHTTVIHACRKTEALLKTDSETKRLVDELLRLMQPSPPRRGVHGQRRVPEYAAVNG